MWSVIRGMQGVSVGDESMLHESRYERNQRSIMMHEMKPHPRSLDPNIFTRPYGELEYEKACVWMLDDDIAKRQQAMDCLLELYTLQRENVVRSLRYGFLELLLSIIHHDEVEEIRCKAAKALALLVCEPKALDMLLELDNDTGALRDLLNTLKDPSKDVVILAFRVMIACRAAYNAYEATLRLIKYGFIERCISLLHDDDNRVTGTAISALATIFVVKEAFIPFMRANGMSEVAFTLTRDDPFVISEAAEVVTHAAAYRLGKKAAVKNCTLAALLPHIMHENLRVRTAVTGAVAQLTIYEPGKEQAVHDGIATVLSKLLMQEQERDVLVNVVKGIVNIAEHPVGRRQLLGVKERLLLIAKQADDYQPLTSSISEALTQLERKC